MKYNVFTVLLGSFSVILSCSPKQQAGNSGVRSNAENIVVAAYYFPNYHTGDKRHASNPDKGANWSEWALVENATPRFANHYQPLKPVWGYEDEKDPAVMQRKIDVATSHGVNCFIFDWYMFEDGPFLNRCLDEGFLKAKNVNTIQFALMWANHDWTDIHPYTRGTPEQVLYPGKVSPQRFEEIGKHVIENYFSQPNYLQIDGRPYFSIYHLQEFIGNFGSVQNARLYMDKWDKMARDAGFKGVHWNIVGWGNPILPGETVPTDIAGLIKGLKATSATSYVWVHHVHLPQTQTDYNYVRDKYFEHWYHADSSYGVPYFPNITVGWDPTPRCDTLSAWSASGYPFMNTIDNNTPANFKKALEITKERVLSKSGFKMININCWNEWTEGSQLEPEERYGMGYLEAVKEVFTPSKK